MNTTLNSASPIIKYIIWISLKYVKKQNIKLRTIMQFNEDYCVLCVLKEQK